MKKFDFQVIIGFAWFFSQISTIFHLYLQYRNGGYLFEEFTTTASIVGPMFLGFTAAFVTLVIKSNAPGSREFGGSVSLLFVVFTSIVVVLFVAFLNLLVREKAHSQILSFEQFKLTIATLQTFLGVYVGGLLGALFGVESPKTSFDARGLPIVKGTESK